MPDSMAPLVVWTPPGWESALVARIEEQQGEIETLRAELAEAMLARIFRAVMGTVRRVEYV